MEHWAKWRCLICGKENITKKLGMNQCECTGSAVDLNELFIGTRYIGAENLGHSETIKTDIMETKEDDIPKWAKRELYKHAINGANVRDDNYEIDVNIAYETGLKILKNGGNMDEAFYEMNWYLQTLD